MRKKLARADLVTAAALFVFAAAVLVESIRMPRFTSIGATTFTAPGIVPGFYAVVIGLLSIALAFRAVNDGALRREPAEADPSAQPQSLKRMVIAAALGLVFIVLLLGTLPFWLAAAVYVAAFIIIFEWQPGLGGVERAKAIGTAAVIGVVTGVATTLVFQNIFLVRLP